MPRNTTLASRPRELSGGESGATRTGINAMIAKLGVICDTLDADASVTSTTAAATIVDDAAAPSTIGGTSGTFIPPPIIGAGLAIALAFVQQPATVVSAIPLSSVVVEARSADGARALEYVGVVTVAIESQSAVSPGVRDVVLRATATGLTLAISAPVRVTS